MYTSLYIGLLAVYYEAYLDVVSNRSYLALERARQTALRQ